LSLFDQVTPQGDTATEQFSALLDDGTKVVFQRRTVAVQRTEALLAEDGDRIKALPDGEYRLAEGGTFRVVDGGIDFDAVFADPDGVEPFRQYGAWREVVAIDNPLLSLEDAAAVTDVVRFLADDGRSYYVVQSGKAKDYAAYVVVDRKLRQLEDGTYPLPAGRTFEVSGGSVTSDSLAKVKVFAQRSTRLPQ
jgi:hypothetical protein